MGVVEVPDHRIYDLAGIFNPKNDACILPVLWILQGWWQEHRRGRAGEPVLSHIRETDAIAHVVRCFDDENITHVEGGINPVRDMGIINTELCLADLESVDKKRVKTAKLAQAGIKEAKAVLPIYERVFQVLQEGIPARTLDLAEDELAVLKELNLITLKPVLYVLNTAEDDIANPIDNPYVQAAAAQAEKKKMPNGYLFQQRLSRKYRN